MDKKEAYHFIGIGGIGMSALAQILLEKEHKVSGSDLSLNATLKLLERQGARVMTSHSSENILNQRVVVYGSAISKDNPEMIAAQKQECALMHRSELLAKLISSSKSLAVTGMHGKTTTTALLSSLLLHAERDISFAIGGYLKEYGVNGRFGKDALFVFEADESDNSFLRYYPSGAIITNIEEEHMDCFVTRESLHDSFAQFFDQIEDEKLLFYCGDDEVLRKIAKNRGASYGFSEGCDYHLSNYHQEGWSLFFDLRIGKDLYKDIEVALIGRHNALNAAAVVALALTLGLSEEQIRGGLKAFKGVAKRCDKTFEDERILLIDDYAHHPTEIQSTLKAIRKAIGERRLVVIFQPHRYTRTQRHFKEFVTSFDDADLLFVNEIYAASEEAIPGVDARSLVEKIRESSTLDAHYLPLDEALEKLGDLLSVHDVVVTMGAGDITYFNHKLAQDLEKREIRKLRVGIIFGGQSVEHLISHRSAGFVASSLSSRLYELSYFAIDKRGKWQMGERAKKMLGNEEEFSFEGEDCFFTDQMRKEVERLDLFFPVLHGTNGEDGTLQGLFEILQKPYVGPDHRSAAVGMDKVMTKRLLQSGSVLTPSFVAFDKRGWQQEREHYLEEIREKLSYPLYVKPSHLGSSVGVNKVYTEEELLEAISYAFLYDTDLLVEKSIEGGRELEFAVLGNGHACRVAPPGEKLAEGAFITYEMKYGDAPVKSAVVAELEEAIVKKGQALALQAYRTLGGSGMMRVDFILDREGSFWCFEVNPIPGMQKFSLFPKMWEKAGLSNSKLFDRLIILALERRRMWQRTRC